MFYSACSRALGGLDSKDAAALAAWLAEADSAAIIGGYGWEPALSETLLLALGDIYTLSFRDRWEFSEWARKNNPKLLKAEPPSRKDNINPKAEAPENPES